MPLYLYEHVRDNWDPYAPCRQGLQFECVQRMSDDRLTACPACGVPVIKLISPGISHSAPKTDSEIKGMGFTKLVRRDKGVYENVTALDGESKVWETDKPETMPDMSRRITD